MMLILLPFSCISSELLWLASVSDVGSGFCSVGGTSAGAGSDLDFCSASGCFSVSDVSSDSPSVIVSDEISILDALTVSFSVITVILCFSRAGSIGYVAVTVGIGLA